MSINALLGHYIVFKDCMGIPQTAIIVDAYQGEGTTYKVFIVTLLDEALIEETDIISIGPKVEEKQW